jgi:hypothetical protein
MSFENRKEITVKVKGYERRYNVYEKNGRIFYFNTKSSPRRDVELEKNSLTSQEKAWVKSQDNSRPKFKVLAAIAKKIEQDIKIKDEELTQKIAENFKKPTIQQAASAAIVMQKFVRRRQAKKVVQAKREAAAPKSDEQTLLSESDAFSVASYRSENSEGSLKELSARPRGSRVLRGDEATLSSDSSVSTNSSTGSYEARGGDKPNSTIIAEPARRNPSSASINSMEVEPSISGAPSTLHSQSDLWSGRTVDLGSDGDNVSELGEDEDASVSPSNTQPPPSSTPPPPSPTQPTDDLTALYDELQAIVDILAHLKGNEPQLAKVREALNNAIEKTGGQVVRPRPEATVEPPNAGVAGAETSPAPKVDDIEENIRLLREVQGKLESLLINHGSKMDDGLRDALVELQKVVDNSIKEATNAKNTKGLRERVDAERSAPSMQISPLGPDTQYTVKSTGPQNMGEDDDMTQDSITPGYSCPP